jgi:methyl-accepting chemotaxis protein
MDVGLVNVSQGVILSKEVKEALTAILSNIRSNNTQVQNISASGEEITANVQEAENAIENIQENIERSSQIVEQLSAFNTEINISLSSTLHASETNVAASQEVSASSSDVSRLLQRSQDQLYILMQKISELTEQLNRFKVSA